MKNTPFNFKSVYVHFPFCSSKCRYCHFTSFSDKSENIKNYLTVLQKELSHYLSQNTSAIETLYFGGGTPSVIPTDIMVYFLEGLFGTSYFMDLREFTIEINPEVKIEFLKEIMKFPVNRISVGVQSFNDRLLTILGRGAKKRTIFSTLEFLIKNGFQNISCDLIIGIPGQTLNNLVEDVKILKDFGIPHISVYCLEINKRDKLVKFVRKTGLNFPDENKVSKFYERVQQEFSGFIQYEISNFAKTGYEAKHNFNYWNFSSYLGVGVSAHSFFNEGFNFYRWKNVKNLETYLSKDFRLQKRINNYKMDRNIARFEYIFLALRTSEGLNLNSFKEVFQEDFEKLFEREIFDLLNKKFLIKQRNKIQISPDKYIISNSVLHKFCNYV